MLRRILIAFLLLAAPVVAQEAPRIVGGPGPGCIAGAMELPEQGPGYVTIRTTRSFFWGHPDTIASLRLLASRAQQAGMGTLYMNDISKPRGGPFPGIHASHMTGLDADVWLDVRPKVAMSRGQRDAIEVETLVRADQRGIEPRLWSPQHVALLRMASELPNVDRVLVNPAIKKQLCQDAGADRAWLRRMRPYYGHAAHMHIHFRCPAGQSECVDQVPPPPGDGCDASLQWWFDQLDQPPKPAGKPAPPVRLPAACTAILAGGR